VYVVMVGITTAGLCTMSATDLAEAIRAQDVSSREVVEAHLRRIADLNPAVSAVPVVLAEQVLDAARAADFTAASGGELPSPHGVPLTVKGNIDLAGTLTASPSRSR
jgi:Asp-tRNA(Asn)/Glu-tRNA(Gln) amidotransferase A subunit family amidase